MAGTALGEPRGADFAAGTALGELRSVGFVAGTALGEPRAADFVAGAALCRVREFVTGAALCEFAHLMRALVTVLSDVCSLDLCLVIHTPRRLDLLSPGVVPPRRARHFGQGSLIHYLDVCSGDCVLRGVLSLVFCSLIRTHNSLSFTSILPFTHARIHCHTLTHPHSLTDSLTCCVLW